MRSMLKAAARKMLSRVRRSLSGWTLVLLAAGLPLIARAAGPSVQHNYGEAFDGERERAISFRLVYSKQAKGRLPVVVLSHDGEGAYDGHTRMRFLGDYLAANGYIVAHLNHMRSATAELHWRDRPLDVTYFLDELVQAKIPWPFDLNAQPDLTRVGVVGFDLGANTAQALVGADFGTKTPFDSRIKAIVAVSPPGPFRYGAADHSWRSIATPVLTFVGGAETDGSIEANLEMAGWRLVPFVRYGDQPPKILVVLPGVAHEAMAVGVSAPMREFMGLTAKNFLDQFVKGVALDVCRIGVDGAPPSVQVRVKGMAC